MDPSLVKTKKCCPPCQAVPLTPLTTTRQPRLDPTDSNDVLRFKAGLLKYQGMCLQYQASLIEDHASLQPSNEDHASLQPPYNDCQSGGTDPCDDIQDKDTAILKHPDAVNCNFMTKESEGIINSSQGLSQYIIPNSRGTSGDIILRNPAYSRHTPHPLDLRTHRQSPSMPRIFFRTETRTNCDTSQIEFI